MLVVTGVEVVEVEGKEWERMTCRGHLVEWSEWEIPRDVEVEREYVRGREFVDGRGKRRFIGLTGEVSEALGLPFEVIERQAKQIGKLYEELREVRGQGRRAVDDLELERGWIAERCAAVRGLTFWDRVLLLFGFDGNRVIGRRAEKIRESER